MEAEPVLSFEGRLLLLRDSGQASDSVVNFAREEILQLASELGISLETEGAGMLVNHLVLALERARSGDSYIASAEVAQLLAAELDNQAALRDRARQLGARARQQLRAELPDGEIDFLAMHLAALMTAEQMED